jgi:hypothetical protein
MDYITARAADLGAKSSTAFDIAFSSNPEKIRAMLNLWFVPEFKPKFVKDRAPRLGGLDDVELLGPSTEQARVPIRMFDIDTGNLVERPDIGVMDQYCILSHSWKGREVDYAYVSSARWLDLNRAMYRDREMREAKAADPEMSARQDDIQMIKAQCKEDIEKQETIIKALTAGVLDELGLSDTCDIVRELLDRHIKVNVAEKGISAARKELEEAVANLEYSKMEDKVFQNLLDNIELREESSKIGKMGKNHEGGVTDTPTSRTDISLDIKGEDKEGSGDQKVSGYTKKAEDPETTRVENARKQLAEAARIQRNTAHDVAFFQRHSRVLEAVDEMVGLMQRWKSSIKIEESIKQSREVFDKKLFPTREKRYLWLDTCCINKALDSELVESLSLMGDWYASAEFCLVHLDTKKSAEEWIQEWDRFKQGSDSAPPKPNITSFKSIHEVEPEWATRGWTLQELVLSKTTFYVNSSWSRLGRPVESIGPYYYLCPFIDLYVNNDENNPYVTLKNLKHLAKLRTLMKILRDGEVKVRRYYVAFDADQLLRRCSICLVSIRQCRKIH